jgi:hypothetical protein
MRVPNHIDIGELVPIDHIDGKTTDEQDPCHGRRHKDEDGYRVENKAEGQPSFT